MHTTSRKTATTTERDEILRRRSEAAEQLNISLRTLDDLVARRLIGVVKWGGNVRIPQSELDRFIAERFEPSIDAA